LTQQLAAISERENLEKIVAESNIPELKGVAHTRTNSIGGVADTRLDYDDSSTSTAMFESPELRNFLSQNDESRRNS
jgi:hypothetical protein